MPDITEMNANVHFKRRLGAWDIHELPLLAASSKMETAPMAGKILTFMKCEHAQQMHTLPATKRPSIQEHMEPWRMCVCKHR